MPGRKKTGQEVPCCVCGTMIYRCGGYLARGHKRHTCKNPACKSASVSGKNNPFWDQSHGSKTLSLMREKKRLNPSKGTGPKKGFKHTPEARQKITEALKRRWSDNRDKMLSQLQRPLKPRELLRYRRNFTPLQRKTWKEPECSWCGTTSKLILDHIIPVMCGGTNERKNSQTLCQPCNIWKMVYVDRKLFLAGLGKLEG